MADAVPAERPVRRVLHVVNYAWPHVDGYVVRTMGVVAAQERTLGLEVQLAVSPYDPLAAAADRAFTLPTWGPDRQASTAALGADGAPIGPQSWERPGVGLTPVTGPAFARGLEQVARRFRPDVIHAHHPHYVGRTARRVARRLGLPFVYEARCFNGDYDLDLPDRYSRLRGRWFNRLEYALARRADAVVTISDGLAERLRRAGVPAERVHVVRNSVDTARFAPVPGERAAGDDLPERGGDSDTLHVGYATTFESIENLDALVRAAGLAAPRVAATGRTLRVTIAGAGRDWERIRALVDELGLQDTVELPGFVPYGQMPDFYRALDLFVVPRGHASVVADTTPLKPLEALAVGCPLLATELPALVELCGGRPDVRFAAPTAEALAEGIGLFAEEPWAGSGAVAERSWAREIRRYPAIYEQAARTNAARR